MEKMIEMARSFRGMNTEIEAILCIAEGEQKRAKYALERTEQYFKAVERRLSRFHPASELSLLNTSSGASFKASPLLFKVVKAALEAARITGGIFDPTILPNLLAAGYNQSFENLAGGHPITRQSLASARGCWRDIKLDAESGSIFLPQKCSIDLGGIGKGWSVDRVCDRLEIFANYAVNAGGDIRVKGKQADGLPWTIGVADPFREAQDLTLLELSRCAVCTSTVMRRKWEMAGRTQHHIIDPRTGKPSQSDVVSATVIADTAARAEIITKTIIILGAKEGLKFVESQPGTSALLVLKDREVARSAGFKERRYVAA